MKQKIKVTKEKIIEALEEKKPSFTKKWNELTKDKRTRQGLDRIVKKMKNILEEDNKKESLEK